ncbi:MAG TPA: hypothetical protein VEK15_19285 [Vicinamibacteria bacterium]|nr:hypothetical protein [Vicinamibacteria bacterium]
MRSNLLFLFPLLVIAGTGVRSVEAQPAPDWVVANWKNLIGVWIADNSAYKTEEASMDSFGLEWTWGIGNQSLVGRLYGIKDGEEVATFWEFREFWHPGEQRLLTTQFGRDGTYGAGPHHQNADGSTEMLQTFYDAATGRATRVGHRAVLKADEHTTQSFDVDESGTWKERRTYIWRRQR